MSVCHSALDDRDLLRIAVDGRLNAVWQDEHRVGVTKVHLCHDRQ